MGEYIHARPENWLRHTRLTHREIINQKSNRYDFITRILKSIQNYSFKAPSMLSETRFCGTFLFLLSPLPIFEAI